MTKKTSEEKLSDMMKDHEGLLNLLKAAGAQTGAPQPPIQVVGSDVSDKCLDILKYVMEQHLNLTNYSVAQSQAIVSLYRKLVQVDAFLKELAVTFDFSEEDEEELKAMVEKYGLNNLISPIEGIPQQYQ